ncbi:hypothetical protein CAPTEDRAFT_190065 [Capitella teleta]|uniref:CRAL-TRIO domain-containing protein n=1 Tax=Capitella teleta TaxID=283909 RepID=R7TWD1_CAPTE|nr:hypothetical protein CAPTEDRAFT_190065 [Capitella teleta]|eukprot:ELT95285.1 hypothetical protein CAPTEDRAFT_190065 [Capitella teleta]
MADDLSSYVCRLTPESLEKAKKEINEDPEERINAARQLKQWILDQPHLTCRTDMEFLMMFLRGAKFSQLRAREMIEGMMTLRSERTDWFDRIDTHEAELQRYLKSGYILPLPKKDSEGRLIFLNRVGLMDPGMPPKYRFRVTQMVGHFYGRDENVQVNGMVMIIDFTGFTTKHLSAMNMGDMKKFSNAMQKFMPGRLKAFHYYNVGSFMEAIMAVIKQVMRQKFRDRLHVHNTMESLYKYIPMEMLPVEYLPDEYEGPHQGKLDDITADLVKKISEDSYRNELLKNTTGNWGIDESKRVKVEEPAAAFRKLNVD